MSNVSYLFHLPCVMMHDDDAQTRPGGQAEGSEWERGQKIKIVIPGGEAGGMPLRRGGWSLR